MALGDLQIAERPSASVPKSDKYNLLDNAFSASLRLEQESEKLWIPSKILSFAGENSSNFGFQRTKTETALIRLSLN